MVRLAVIAWLATISLLSCSDEPSAVDMSPTSPADTDVADDTNEPADTDALDSDADGLTDDQETLLGLDPNDPDTDDDGTLDGADCLPADPLHWSDCGACADADGDGRGPGCNFPEDCNDGDATIYGGAPDVYADGVDSDCDTFDGPGALLFDTFDSGQPLATGWDPVPNNWVTDDDAYSGAFSLRVPSGKDAQTTLLDTTGCTQVLWAYQVYPPDDAEEELLVVEYHDGTDWFLADRVVGSEVYDRQFHWRSGVLGPRALSASFRLRFTATETVSDTGGVDVDTFQADSYVDDVLVACTELDTDGDGRPATLDCDEMSALHWSDCTTCQDLDGDGYGEGCDLWDCEDADASVNPSVADTLGDGVDSDCTGADGIDLVDDFEDGATNRGVWDAMIGEWRYDSDNVYDGTFSLAMRYCEFGGPLRSIDTSACTTVAWTYQTSQDDPWWGDLEVRLEWFDGSEWVVADAFPGADPRTIWLRRGGAIEDPAALSSDFRARLISDSPVDNYPFDVYLDDLEIRCGSGDADGDGIDGAVDCAPTDAAHWFDCGLCADADGDMYGVGCDLGDDCDDMNALAFPGGSDLVVDGVDGDCSGMDGPGFLDSFELGALDDRYWDSFTDLVWFFWSDTGDAHSGEWYLVLSAFAEEQELLSLPIDTSECPTVIWAASVKRNANADVGQDLVVEWWNGAAWIETGRVLGTAEVDWVYRDHVGMITDPAGSWSDFQYRLRTDGLPSSLDVDDVMVGCGFGDSDGDGVDDAQDCDVADPLHWFDCGLCVDDDGDDMGFDCDLGPDCNDTDAAIHPGAPDVAGDAVDADCTGVDGPGFYDGFEAGVLDLILWTDVMGDPVVTDNFAHAGLYSLATGEAEPTWSSRDLGTSGCASIGWTYWSKRSSNLTPDVGEALALEWWDGAAWIEADRFEGTGVADLDFLSRAGSITDAAALWDGFRFRFVCHTDWATEYLVDDIEISCD